MARKDDLFMAYKNDLFKKLVERVIKLDSMTPGPPEPGNRDNLFLYGFRKGKVDMLAELLCDYAKIPTNPHNKNVFIEQAREVAAKQEKSPA